jgi:hypothetical protein
MIATGVSDARFLHALNFCMLLPGPEATQLATYLGLADAWGEGRHRGGGAVRAARRRGDARFVDHLRDAGRGADRRGPCSSA